MPFDSQGKFTRVHNWEQDRIDNIDIVTDHADEEDDNFAQALNETFLRDGRVSMKGNINAGGFVYRKAKAIGVDSFWYKELEEVPIMSVMERTMKGEHIYPDTTPELLIGNAKSSEFSEMELDILREVTTGATNKEISEKLYISPATVNYYINDLLVKTGYKNRVQLAVKARLEGLVIGNDEKEKTKEE